MPPGVERESLKALCVGNLRWAAGQAARAGCDILIEPTNLRDVPRYFLNRQDHAHELLDAAQVPHLKVLMDLYHCQLVEGDLHGKLQRYLPTGRVAHIQVAGVPARHEPDRGELRTTRSCSTPSTPWATRAGWGANTPRRQARHRGSAGGTGPCAAAPRTPHRSFQRSAPIRANA